MSIVVKEFESKRIRVRNDGYFSATDMCNVANKFFADWRRLKSTVEYLTVLERSMSIPIDRLIQINESQGTNDTRGTWVHRRVAIRLAQWVSADFAIQVDTWIDELLTTGTVSIKEPQPELPPIPYEFNPHSLEYFVRGLEVTSANGDTQLYQLLKAKFSNILLADMPELYSTEAAETFKVTPYEGVVTVANRLGFEVPSGKETSLGKYVKKRCGNLITGQNPRISLKTGTMIQVNMYPANHPSVEQAVKDFFASIKRLSKGSSSNQYKLFDL